MAHPKGVLIERLQQDGKQPKFTTSARGPDHAPEFEAEVVVDGAVLGRGQGTTKRTAERRAAEEALAHLEATSAPLKATKRSGSRGRNRKAASRHEVDASPTPDTTPAMAEHSAINASTPVEPLPPEAFEGPWPVFEEVLAGSLSVANQRISSDLRGDAARVAIEAFALQLYKNLLLDLGDVVEDPSDGNAPTS